MNITNRQNKYNPNFGSVKLAGLTLKKVLPNSQVTEVAAELHKLQVSDLPVIEKLYLGYNGRPPKYLKDIFQNLKNACSPKMDKMAANKRFLCIKQEDKIIAICEATIKQKEIYLNFIVNLCRATGFKGLGSSLIVNLVEFAQKAKKSALTLSADKNAFGFYKKLHFTFKPKEDFELVNNSEFSFNDFLKIFKPKYYK